MRRVLNSSIRRVKRFRKLRITFLGNKELQVLISLLCGLGFLRKLTNQNLNRLIGLFLYFILFQKDFELILGLLIASNYYLIVTLFQSVILSYFKPDNCFFVGETNNSAGSEIGNLFLTSCSVVFLIFPIHTTFQLGIIKNS